MSASFASPKIDAAPAKLTIGGKEIELPILVGTENDRAIDISKLLKETGHTTIDDGFANTAATSSSITYLDGDRGILRYRGYPIEELAEHCDFFGNQLLDHLRRPADAGATRAVQGFDREAHDAS